MKLQGSITQIKSRVNASGDTVNSVLLEVFGEVKALHDLMKRPLAIELAADEKGPFDQ